MPLISIRYKPEQGYSKESNLSKLLKELPAIVAKQLGGCKAEEIEIWTTPANENDVVHDFDFQIVIDANDFPLRREHLESRREWITEDLKQIGLKGPIKTFVWLRLFIASFGELELGGE